MNYGMTPQGFVPKRLADILEDLNAGLAGIVDPASGEKPMQNAADDSLLQQFLGVVAEGLSECWEAAYDAAVQFDPLKNTGAGQAGTIQLNGMLLKPGAPSLITLALRGKAGAVIPQGARVATADGRQVFAVTETARLDSEGRAEAAARCLAKGPVDPAPGTVISIQTPQPGWQAAENIATLAVGSFQESEAEARRRQQRSTALTSYRQIEAIYAAVLNVPGVLYCRAYQNPATYPADQRGIPFKEVAVVAEGGEPRAIAEALFLRFPLGVIGHGNTVEVFYDRQGVSHPISFSRPVSLPVAVDLDIVVTDRAGFPDNGVELLKQAIADYARYGGQGNQDGFPPGSPIICSRLYTPANSVPGHKIARLEIAVQPDTGEPQFSGADIPVAWDEVGRFDVSRIRVNLLDAAPGREV